MLGGLSFTASPGQKVAFVGKAGCGKSTAIDLLQRFYSSTGGEILVDGESIDLYDPSHLRRHCGVVSQVNPFACKLSHANKIEYNMENFNGF